MGWRAGSIMPWVTSGKSFASLSLSFHVCKIRIQRCPVGIGVRAGDNSRVWWALCLFRGSSGTDARGVCAGPATCPREQRKQSWSGPRVQGGAGDDTVRWLLEGCRRPPGPPVPGPIPPPLTSGSASSLLSPGGGQPSPSWASSPLSFPPAGTGLLCSFHLTTRPKPHITSHPPSSGRFLSPHRRPGTV